MLDAANTISSSPCHVVMLAVSNFSDASAELTDAGQAQAEDLHTLLGSNDTFKAITGNQPTRAIVSPLSRSGPLCNPASDFAERHLPRIHIKPSSLSSSNSSTTPHAFGSFSLQAAYDFACRDAGNQAMCLWLQWWSTARSCAMARLQ